MENKKYRKPRFRVDLSPHLIYPLRVVALEEDTKPSRIVNQALVSFLENEFDMMEPNWLDKKEIEKWRKILNEMLINDC